jgi:hypothetical protein
VQVDRETVPGKAALRAEITIGRELWLHSMRHLLTNTASVLLDHDWCILKPYAGCRWFTSDHPVIRLNYNAQDDYDFGGGWGSRGSEVILPLSPVHLLYTQIGHAAPVVKSLSHDQTILIQRFVAERAHRWIIAHGKPMRAVWFRKRMVDMAAFQVEQEERKRWHSSQTVAERSRPERQRGDQGAA